MNSSIFILLVTIPGALIAVTIHEYTKALCSTRLGDNLPKRKNRLTLNPFKHQEPIGFICMLIFGFGWGKPVETSQMYYKDRKKSTLITYITPSVVNLLVGCFFAALLSLTARIAFPVSVLNAVRMSFAAGISKLSGVEILLFFVYYIVYFIIRCNISLALFNIIPVYPLDGAKVLSVFLSPNAAIKMTANEKIFQLILLLFLFLGVISSIINPICNAIMRFI